MDAWIEIGVFAAKGLLIFIVFAAIILLIAANAAKAAGKNELEIERVDKKLQAFADALLSISLSKSEKKAEKKKNKQKEEEEENDSRPRLFVLNFEGDIKASGVEQLRDEVSTVLSVARNSDEVLVKVKSPGGAVNGYGLAAAQLMRLRDQNIHFTVAVDEVAASGGYMMAVTANKILCAPFAIVGSIGVVAQVPNFNRLLKKWDVDYKEYTAGDYKRTVSLFGEITEKGEQKFLTQIEETHVLFKNFVTRFRPQLDLAKIATGEYWFGEQAKDLGLIDEIGTSDSYLLNKMKTHRLISLKIVKKQKLAEKLSGALSGAIRKALQASIEELESRRF